MSHRSNQSGSKRSNSRSRSGSKSRKIRVLSRLNKPVSYGLNVIPEELMENLNSNDECIDTEFLVHYPKNMVRIREALKESGQYKFNKENVEKFITEQLSPIRREAAADLIENTIYIRLEETMDIVEELIHRIYAKFAETGETRQPYMFCGPRSKSFYFFACISLFYIKKHGYQIPHFLKLLTPNFMEKFDAPLIIVDDAAYSASQLAGMVGEIYYHRREIGLRPLDIIIGLTALNTIALERLSKVPIEKSRMGINLYYLPTPYDIIYLPERLYPALPLQLGLERYFNLNLFFNACLSSETNVALYLDHKVADSTSTYKNVYVYGPIVPYDYTNDIPLSRDYVICKLFSFYNFRHKDKMRLLRRFVQENPNFLQIMPNALDGFTQTHVNKINYFLHNKAIERDIIDKRYKQGIQFYPFIQKCSHSNKLKEIINNPEIKNMQYLMFMHDNGVLDINQYGEVIRGYLNETYTDKVLRNKQDLYNQELIANIVRLVDLLESHRCPSPFYKKGILKLI